MGLNIHGIAHLYGVSGRIANATILSFSEDETPLVEDHTYDEDGRQIERRYDDIQNEATITIRLRASYAKPVVGTVLTYDNVKYEIASIGKSQEAQGHRTMTLKVRNSEHVTLP